MTGRRLRRLGAVLFASMLVMAACGDDDSGDTTTTAEDETTTSAGEDTTTTAGEAADVTTVEEGKLTVCTELPYSPFEFEDEEGNITGYDMEIMEAIASDNSLEFNPLNTPFDTILVQVNAGDCDVVASAVTITDEREEEVDFSDPYYDSDQSMLVRAEDAETYTTLDDFAGQKIGVQLGTTGADYAAEHAPDDTEIVEYEAADALFPALQSGEVAGVLQDLPVNAERAQQDDNFVLMEETLSTGEQYGFAVAKDNTAMLDLINEGLQSLEESGDLDTLYAKYFTVE